MRVPILFMPVLVCAQMLVNHAFAADLLDLWGGIYRYDDAPDVQPDSPGSEQIVTYKLVIDKTQTPQCMLIEEGFQADEQIICSLSGDAKEITVAFQSYGDGRIANHYDVAVYKVGAPLFILKHHDAYIEALWKQMQPNITKAGPYYFNHTP